MNLTEYGKQVIDRAMSTRMMTRSVLVEISELPQSVVDMFTSGRSISQDNFGKLCGIFGIEPALICEIKERAFPLWLSLFLRDFCYAMHISEDGFTYIIRGDRFKPPISNPIGIQVKFIGHICVVKLDQDTMTPLECFDIPEDGSLFMQKLLKATEHSRLQDDQKK